MSDVSSKKPEFTASEALFVVFKGLPPLLIMVGLLIAMFHSPHYGAMAIAAGVAAWGFRVIILTPLLLLVAGKPRLTAAWDRARKRG
ncbi:MAG: hypothetical protein KGL46_03800 [Hyphomicrobiales bacterium]|nr:hypothetical protein [Hyphomicrobiales bacterium]